MIQRQCPECGGELVLARRSDEQASGFRTRLSNYWRCSICGGEFTAEQVRENKRAERLHIARLPVPLHIARLPVPLQVARFPVPLTVNRRSDDGSSSRMGDEGCPNEGPGVDDATGYSREEEEVEAMPREEVS